ncbi:hypothetical protein [Ureaplasma ceti]|uniref:Uncharacterized protein n=1 Tax=Ureaplasma ceti TaxID=3119530 RepID=A0ABP9U844_9BACT
MMTMMNFFYKAGNYPTTRQGFLDMYVEEIFDRNKQSFLRTFNLEQDPYGTLDNVADMTLQYLCNTTAYIIYDYNSNTIVDLAFSNLFDFIWLLQILNQDGVQFSLPEAVYKACLRNFKLYSDRIKPL